VTENFINISKSKFSLDVAGLSLTDGQKRIIKIRLFKSIIYYPLIIRIEGTLYFDPTIKDDYLKPSSKDINMNTMM